MAVPYMGEIRMYAGQYVPPGFADCDGRGMLIDQNRALFDLIKTTYGGDGVTTFNLPDLRGRTPVHQGTGVGLPPLTIGQRIGTEYEVITDSTLPTHSHSIKVSTDTVSETNPANNVTAQDGTMNLYRDSAFPPPGQATMNEAMLGEVGGSEPHNNMMPFQVIGFMIALTGITPVKS